MARYGIGDSDGDGRHALGWYKKEKEEGKVDGSCNELRDAVGWKNQEGLS